MLLYQGLHGVIVDGDTSDWPVDATIVTDPVGDLQTGTQDFVGLRVTNDAYNLYLLVEFNSPVNLRTIDLRLYIDADNDPGTGMLVSGRGMDFSWDFDQNRGTSTLTSRGDIGRGNLIERVAPDALATRHEIAVSLEALPAARTGEPIHIALIEENSFDRIPDIGSTLPYVLTGPLAVQPVPIDTNRTTGTVRIVSWNVLYDSPFKAANQAAFIRILTALQPDIVMFQEIYNTPTDTVVSYFRNYLQIPQGQTWHAARQGDCITVSRFPIEGSWSASNNIVSRHDTVQALGSHLLIGNAHFPCCENESGRVLESGTMLQVIGSRLADPVGAPQAVIIGGDLNSGGIAPELIKLTTELLPLEMASPRHVFEYDQFTWGSLGSSWGSSRLDFLLFDPATLFRHKAFIVDTDMLPADALAEMGLLAGDTFISDHLPLVFDVRSPHLPDLLQAAPMAGDGSTESAWWGPINGYHYPLVHQADMGWIWLYETGNGYWFCDADARWYWTGPDHYPWMWIPRR